MKKRYGWQHIAYYGCFKDSEALPLNLYAQLGRSLNKTRDVGFLSCVPLKMKKL